MTAKERSLGKMAVKQSAHSVSVVSCVHPPPPARQEMSRAT